VRAEAAPPLAVLLYALAMATAKPAPVVVAAAGREVAVSNPEKLYFPEAGITKLDLVHYYLAVAEGALRAAGGRPNVLVRYADGIHGQFFFQKRAPTRPPWIEVVELRFPSGGLAEEVVPRDAASLAWMANLGCLELHPHPVRADDLEHPDEMRIDLDPVPGVEWPQILAVAGVVREVLDAFSLVGWPKTSGSRGIHVNVRIHPRWSFDQVRRAALAFAREVERRAPALATSKWWKEERHGVFLDYNQNAKDRTVASAYSVRPKPDARVSAPVSWDELESCQPEDFTLRTMPPRFAALGDRHAGIDEHPCGLEKLLELSAQQEAQGQGDAPWPPHYRKQAGEPPRAQPSRRVSSKPLIEIGRSENKDEALDPDAGPSDRVSGRPPRGSRRARPEE
jgi:bifunctional non-homologous end joining protein LigD